MKLLLHTCCGPCLMYPYRALVAKGFQVDGYFYNPNIHPIEEYRLRRGAAVRTAQDIGAVLLCPAYNSDEFFAALDGNNNFPERCRRCWRLRLAETAARARHGGYTGFTTTLLVSPYQDSGMIREIGEEVAREVGTKFYFEDFRPGFRAAHNEAKAKGVYCQKYCGCVYSERERSQEQKKQWII